MDQSLITPFLMGIFLHLTLMIILRNTLKMPHHYKNTPTQKKQYSYYISNYVCILHAITMALYGFLTTLQNSSITRPMTSLDKKMLLFSVGYNIYDLIYESYTKIIVTPILIHHSIITTMCTYSVFTEQNAGILGIIYFLGETTNPLLCIHQNLASYKGFERSSKVFGLVYCPLFIFVRVFVSGFFFGRWVRDPSISTVFCWVFSVMFYIGLLWSFQTVNKWFKDLSGFFREVGVFGVKGDPYCFTNRLRYNKRFQFFFKAGLMCVCFLPHLFFGHDNWI